jgi:hypothetical protein
LVSLSRTHQAINANAHCGSLSPPVLSGCAALDGPRPSHAVRFLRSALSAPPTAIPLFEFARGLAGIAAGSPNKALRSLRSGFACVGRPERNGAKGEPKMYTMNQLTLIGFTGQDAEVHYTQNGALVTTLSVATKESWCNVARFLPS